MALFSNHSQYPDGQTIADDTPQLRYNSDRSDYSEALYDVQFRVDDVEVYVSAGIGTLWSDGTGGSRVADPPNADEIHYTLTAGEALSDAAHTFKVYHKHYSSSTWLLEVSSSFTVAVAGGPPSKAVNPSPANSASSVELVTSQLSWDDGGDADTFNVYFGISGSQVLVSSAQVAETWDIPSETLGYGVTYAWRIDSSNGEGTTTGDTWTFTALEFDPPVASGLNNMKTIRRLVAVAKGTFYYEDI